MPAEYATIEVKVKTEALDRLKIQLDDIEKQIKRINQVSVGNSPGNEYAPSIKSNPNAKIASDRSIGIDLQQLNQLRKITSQNDKIIALMQQSFQRHGMQNIPVAGSGVLSGAVLATLLSGYSPERRPISTARVGDFGVFSNAGLASDPGLGIGVSPVAPRPITPAHPHHGLEETSDAQMSEAARIQELERKWGIYPYSKPRRPWVDSPSFPELTESDLGQFNSKPPSQVNLTPSQAERIRKNQERIDNWRKMVEEEFAAKAAEAAANANDSQMGVGTGDVKIYDPNARTNPDPTSTRATRRRIRDNLGREDNAAARNVQSAELDFSQIDSPFTRLRKHIRGEGGAIDIDVIGQYLGNMGRTIMNAAQTNIPRGLYNQASNMAGVLGSGARTFGNFATRGLQGSIFGPGPLLPPQGNQLITAGALAQSLKLLGFGFGVHEASRAAQLAAPRNYEIMEGKINTLLAKIGMLFVPFVDKVGNAADSAGKFYDSVPQNTRNFAGNAILGGTALGAASLIRSRVFGMPGLGIGGIALGGVGSALGGQLGNSIGGPWGGTLGSVLGGAGGTALGMRLPQGSVARSLGATARFASNPLVLGPLLAGVAMEASSRSTEGAYKATGSDDYAKLGIWDKLKVRNAFGWNRVKGWFGFGESEEDLARGMFGAPKSGQAPYTALPPRQAPRLSGITEAWGQFQQSFMPEGEQMLRMQQYKNAGMGPVSATGNNLNLGQQVANAIDNSQSGQALQIIAGNTNNLGFA